MDTILLIDGANCFIRSYSAIPALNANGDPFGGVVGFLWGLKLYIEKCRPSKVIVCWDGKGGSKRRRSIVETYKNGRKPIKLNRNYEFENVNQEDNKIYQRIRLDEYLNDLPIYQVMVEDIEADDAIGYLCKYFWEQRKVIVSGDKDFYQLLNDKTIIFNPNKKIFLTNKNCIEEFGIHSINFALAKAIVGDKSDNVKGVKGIAFKKLLKFFPNFALKEKIDINQLFEECEKDKEKYNLFLTYKDIIIRNLNIMQLDEPIISSSSILKIKNFLDNELYFSRTSFRMKLVKDGILNINDNFFEPFNSLSIKENGK